MSYRLFAIGLLVPVGLSGQALDLARFGNPPADVRPALIWYWNGQITDSLIDRQLVDMRHAGLTNVVITPVESRLDPAYSSDGWFARIEHALREAQRTGMRVWLSAADSSLAGLNEYSRRFPWAFGNVLKGFWGKEPAATAPPQYADTGRPGRILRGAFARAAADRLAAWRDQRTDWARQHGVEFVVPDEGHGTAGVVGAADWTLTPEQLRARIGALAARGRLAPLAIHGYWSDPADVPTPPSLDPSNPWSLALSDLVTWAARVTLLARGRPATTMALVYPTRAAQAWAGTPEGQRLDSAFAALVANLDSLQASFDIVPEEMLDENEGGIRIAAGVLHVRGQRYRVILAPPVRTMSRETVGWLAALARSGGTVIAWRPLPSEEARGSDAALASAWPDTSPRFRVLDSLPQLTQALIRASWSGVREPNRSALRVLPLERGEDRVFLLFNASDSRIAIAPTFRMIGQPELWNPDDGAMRLAPTRWSPRMAVTDVPIELDPFQVVGIVFRARPRSPRGPIGPPTHERTIAQAGAWRFRFASAATDTTWHEQPLGSWTVLDSTYSGTGVYEGTIEVPASTRAVGHVWLDLGRVRDVAEVELNGTSLGRRLWRPYRYEVSKILQTGTNRITVRVTNTLANRKGQPLPSGLLGAVRLIQSR